MRRILSPLMFILAVLFGCFLTAASLRAQQSQWQNLAQIKLGNKEPTPTASPDSVIERSLPSMALVLIADGAGPPSPVACAFVRRPDGVLLTSLQAVKNTRHVQVTLTSGEVYENVEVIASDEHRDAAALRIPASRLPVIPAGASEELKSGDAVYAVYASAVRAWVVVPAVYQGVRMSNEIAGTVPSYRLLEFTPPISPRLNGGVLLNAQGHALGLLVSFPKGLNAGYAVPLESIAGLADVLPGNLSSAVSETLPTPAIAPSSTVTPKPPQPLLESKTAATGSEPLARKSDATDKLRAFTSYYVKSDTIYMHRETLQKELDKRPEFSAWGLTPVEDQKAADVVIVITLPFLTWEWNYRMIYQPTGVVLGSGKVSAAIEKTAAPQLAKMIVERIRTARPLPASFRDVEAVRLPSATSALEKERSWKVKYVSGTGVTISKDTSVTVNVSREWIRVSTSGAVAFSVPAGKVQTVDSRSEVHKATKGWEDFWGSFLSGADDSSAGGVLLVVPIILLGEAILTPMKTTDHFVSIYWLEDGAIKTAEFRASAEDSKSFLTELKKVSGRYPEDLQELAEKRQKVIKDEYDKSPVLEIERQVNIGWHVLTPGKYHLIVVPRERDLAEVYFFPVDKPAPDFQSASFRAEDMEMEAVAELERRQTPLADRVAPTVSYREQNGIVTFNQIETDELILRFTPVPLGIAK